MNLTNLDQSEVRLTANYIHRTIEMIRERRARAREQKQLLYFGEGKVIRPKNEDDSERIYEYQVDHPHLYYYSTYKKKRTEKVITKLPEEWENGYIGIMDRNAANRFFRYVRWTMNYMANPLAQQFMMDGWHAKRDSAAPHTHWGWSETELDHPTLKQKASFLVRQKEVILADGRTEYTYFIPRTEKLVV